MWSFARRPRWIVGHALTLTLLTVFISAGVWQWGRHVERQARNADIAAAADVAPLDVSDLARANVDSSFAEANEWRSVRLRGTWVSADAVLVRNRSLNGLAGCYLAAPFAFTGAVVRSELSQRDSQPARPHSARSGVMVVVGWLDARVCDPSQLNQIGCAALPAGESELAGRIRPTQTRGLFGPADAAAGKLASVARVDVERLAEQTSVDLLGFYLELVEHQPSLPVAGPSSDPTNDPASDPASDAASLTLLGPPPTDGGPHLGYALQWFVFALVALVGYPLVLWRQAHPRATISTNQEPTA